MGIRGDSVLVPRRPFFSFAAEVVATDVRPTLGAPHHGHYKAQYDEGKGPVSLYTY